MPIPASGGAVFGPTCAKVIRFAYHGCTNRKFFHIVITSKKTPREGLVVEQLGTYDPMVNGNGEKLVSLNTERITYWIGQGAQISTGCAELLGLAGLLPIHPRSYMKAWRNRRAAKAKSENAEEAS